MDSADLLTRLAEIIDAHDWARLPDLLHPDFTCRLVHTGEVFDRDGWVRLNADYPGFQHMHVEDLVAACDRGVLRARVIGTGPDGGDQVFAVASFATVRDGLIAELTEVWTDVDQQAPDGTRPLAWPEPTERLRFRPMTMADLDDMTTLLSAPDPVRVDRPARDRDDAVRWIEWQERNYADHGFGLWVVETHDGEFVGDCGLTVQDVEGEPHVEVGYHVVPGLRRHGYATEAATAVRDCAAAAGIEHLVAIIRPENTPSQGVARKLGMVVERTAYVHGGDALILGTSLTTPARAKQA